MPRIIRMPTETELPDGPVRDFVALLFRLYRAAHRPTLETISKHIRDGDYAATASKETIRKMLRGTSIPAHWQTVEAVILALCNLAGWTSDDTVVIGHADGSSEKATVMYHAENLWHQALDEPAERDTFQTTSTTGSLGAGSTGLSGPSLGTGIGEVRYDPVRRTPDGHYIADDFGRSSPPSG
jgi:hypothetical protein